MGLISLNIGMFKRSMKTGTFDNFFNILFYLYYLKRSEKMSWKGHGKVIEINFWISV